jgi:hypothetical protein
MSGTFQELLQAREQPVIFSTFVSALALPSPCAIPTAGFGLCVLSLDYRFG